MLEYQGLGGVDGKVAGSKHLFKLTTRDGVEKILHDTGSEMGENASGKAEPTDWNYVASGLTAVCLGHAHYDHSGDLPKVYAAGFSGKAYSQRASVDLLASQLRGMVEQAYMNHKRACDDVRGKKDANGKYIPWPKQEFTSSRSKSILENFVRAEYDQRVQISKNIAVTFREAGHIIGSSQAEYEFNDDGQVKRVVVAVDLGRNDMDIPLLRQPCEVFPNPIHYAFIECTYGNRAHTDREATKEMVREVVMRAIKDKKRMLAASFAIMRTQWFLSDLYDIYKEGKLPSDFKIYFDSPTANDVNKVMLKNPDCLDDRAREELLNKNENFLNFPNLVYVPNKQKSMALDSLREPHLLISASGMWFMGRVKSHLKSHISDSQTTLISMGYQCPGCIGSLLEQGKEKNPVIKIDGEDHRYLAEHVRLRGYSAHADGNQCVRHVCEKIKPLVGAFAVHGEQPNIDWTVNEIRKKGRNAQGVVKNKFYRL